ncbi:MAG: hypothetical protein ACRD8U_24055 [Pyrinomonadaceae bacterium]
MRYLFASVVLLCLSQTANAQVLNDRESLRGLDGIGVFYRLEPDKLKEFGVEPGVIAAEVTLRLKKAGIRVLETDAEKKQAKGYPHLLTGVSVWRIAEDRIGFVISVSVLQWMYLARAKETEALYLTTYNRPQVFGDAPLTETGEALRTAVADAVDKFANDYLAANPKR